MTLRRSLLLAALPALLAFAALAAYAMHVTRELGRRVEEGLSSNYRSIVAVRTIRDVTDDLERMLLSDQVPAGAEPVTTRLVAFEEARAVQRGNVTEPGEAAATAALDSSCEAFAAAARAASLMGPGEARVQRFVAEVHPLAEAVRIAARPVVKLNQDAFLAKSSRTSALAELLRSRLGLVAAGALVLLIVFGVVATGRVSRPLVELAAALRAIGEGDLDRPLPRSGGSDEVTTLVDEVRRMSDALRAYRRSSLGELLAAQGLAQAAIDSLRDPVLSFGPAREVRQVNRAARMLLGVDPAAPDPLAPVPAPLREELERACAQVLSGGGPFIPDGLERAIPVTLGGVARRAQVHALPTADANRDAAILGVTALVRDVTSLQAAAELKDDLLSTVAHELRTPLTSLRMAIHLCLEQEVGPLNARQRELHSSARDEVERLHGLVEGILAVSRIKGGGLAARRRPLPLAELLELAVGPARPAAHERRVELECEVPDGRVCDVDKECAALAVGNLIHNAIRHTPEGGRVEVRTRTPAPGWVRVEVHDAGPGIAPEDRERIFSRFQRLPSSPPGGIGLGLSIARDVVHAHGGEIGVESQVGRGSVFWLTLPTARPEQEGS